MDNSSHQSFGVFKPVGHVVISFPTIEQAHDARRALYALNLPGDEPVQYLSDEQMLVKTEDSMAHASPLATIGQELNLVKAQHALAKRGYHWLVVRVPGNDEAAQVAEIVKPFGAERAQHYGHFVIEDLIEAETGLPQVAESPDRGLDAQTPSGREEERADLVARKQ
ncbi:MAG: hypothetical protein ABI574_07115 [Burkholderiales bacterium]